MKKKDKFTKTEFVIYKAVMAFNNQGKYPSHQQIYDAIERNFPSLRYAHESISRVTRHMVEFGQLIKTGDGFKVPMALFDEKAKCIEEQKFLQGWTQ